MITATFDPFDMLLELRARTHHQENLIRELQSHQLEQIRMIHQQAELLKDLADQNARLANYIKQEVNRP